MPWAANATVIKGRDEPEAEVLRPQPSDLDPFFRLLADRCGPSIAGSFTPGQFAALKRAFDIGAVAPHPVDVRPRYSLFGFSFYRVLLMGRRHRLSERQPDRVQC